MAIVPEKLIESLKGVKGFDRNAFEKVHLSGGQITSVRINPAKVAEGSANALAGMFAQAASVEGSAIPWSRYGYYLSHRPSFTFDPLFHAGCYYVQEASSMFVEQALLQTTDTSKPLTLLDLCAAPGGKSTHLQSLLSPDSLLVSNEVIKNRAGILKQNIIKWGCQNVVVTNNDPLHFGRLEAFFDVMVVDAPCSGSGLFRRDEDAINEWSEDAVQLCCGRQKRIISDAIACLKEGGTLIYSTCSYSKEEDEEIADWLISEVGLENERIQIKDDWGIVETVSEKHGAYGYRFFPDKVKGEGFYLACFKKPNAKNNVKLKSAKLEKPTAKEATIVEGWLHHNHFDLFKAYHIYALPKALTERYAYIKNYLNVQYAGIALGEVMKDKLVPEHALALSNAISDGIDKVEVEYNDAIKYLQKADMKIETGKGWKTVTYQHHNLGWINALPNRINNYYPKEFRILKQRDDSAFEK